MLRGSQPTRNPFATSYTVVLDDITMAAFSGTPSHYDVAHGHDCDCRWRRAYSMVGRAGPLADGHHIGALAFAWGSLGRGMVPQLAPPSPFHRAWRAGRGSRWGVVCWWHRSRGWHGSDGDDCWVPDSALARLVDRGARLHRHRTGGTSSAPVARTTQFL
jgi:hypothetical protein